MAVQHPNRHTVVEDPEWRESLPENQGKISGKAGKGGTRRGYVSKNEIEDMTLFDEEPGKSPSKDSS